MYQQALSISEQAFGLEHHRVAESLHGLALLYQREGNGEQAEALFQRTLQIREQHLGRDHPETAHALHDLALLWQQQRRFHEALLLAERALQIQEQALGAAHPKTIDTQVLSTQLVQAHARAEEEKAVSRQETDRSAVHAKSVVVRGTIEQIAYTRTVKMREVTFTCTICSRTVTQLHYPSGRIKYCSQACRAVRGAQIQEQRVAKQREKRRSESEAHRRAQQQDGL